MEPESSSSKIAIRVVSAVLAAGAIWALSRVPGVLHWLGQIGVAFWSHLNGTLGLPNWGLYLLVLMATHTVIHFAKRLMKPKGPKVTAYNQDSFLNLLWRWSYIDNSPYNPWAYCPRCDTVLVYYEHRNPGSRSIDKTVLRCETCNRVMFEHEGDKNYLVEKIYRQIERKIRTGEWIKSINHDSA